MLAEAIDRPIRVIYAAILLVGIAYGTTISVLAIHMDASGIAKDAMGQLAAAFALGIVVFSLPAGWLVSRLGEKAALVGALVGYAACVACFPFLGTMRALCMVRFLDGACSAGVWVSAETALLARARPESRAFVMSLYAIAVGLGYVLGPLLSRAIVPFFGTRGSFVAAGMLACVAAVVVGAWLERRRASIRGSEHVHHANDAKAPDSASSKLAVFWRVKTSCFATFAYGYFQSSVVLFLPLYLTSSKAIASASTILIPGFFAAGMLSLSTWVSRLADRVGHLRVMGVLAALGASMVASFVLLPSFGLMSVAVFVAGATLASISPVSLALQGVVTPEADLGRANAYYNAAYALGMFAGPQISGRIYVRSGGAPMLLHLALMWALFVAMTVVFADDDPRRAVARGALPPG